MFNQITYEEARVIMEMVNLNHFLNDKFKTIAKDTYLQNLEHALVNLEHCVTTNPISCLHLSKHRDIL